MKPIAYLCVGRRADGTKCETTAFTEATAKIWPEANGFVSHYTVPLFAAPRWIPAAERLPDRHVRVLTLLNCEPYEHAHAIGFVNPLGLWSLDEQPNSSGNVTHWMPLPEPPNDATSTR